MIIHVIEDDRAVRSALTVFLEEEGYCVFAYEDAGAFLDRAAPRPTDVILLDIGLPDMPGADLHARLRVRGVEAPVLAISGLRAGPYEAAIRRIRPAGAYRKPLDLTALLSGIGLAHRT